MPLNKKLAWQILDDLPAMETATAKMVSRAKSEVCIMTERFSWYIKVREELISAVNRKVAVKILLLKYDEDTEARVQDMNKYGISVRLAKPQQRDMRFAIVDGAELAALLWDEKRKDKRVYYSPICTKNPGLLSVFVDSFQQLWEKAKPI